MSSRNATIFPKRLAAAYLNVVTASLGAEIAATMAVAPQAKPGA